MRDNKNLWFQYFLGTLTPKDRHVINDGKKASKKAEPSASAAGPAVVPTKKASTSEDAEAAAVARQNQLNEQQAQGFLYFFLLRTVYILVQWALSFPFHTAQENFIMYVQ